MSPGPRTSRIFSVGSPFSSVPRMQFAQKPSVLPCGRHALSAAIADPEAAPGRPRRDRTPRDRAGGSTVEGRGIGTPAKWRCLNEDRYEAAEAIRALVEKITLRPVPNRGEIDATLHGELGTILGWITAQAVGKPRKRETSAAFATGVSVSVVAGIGFEPMTFRL